MKKIFCSALACMALFFSTGTAMAQSDDDQSQTFTKGMNVLNIGIGLGANYVYWGAGYTQSPDIVTSYENGTFDGVGPGIISLGGLFSYTGVSSSYIDAGNGYTYSNHWNYWLIGIRSAYHWNFTTSHKFDPYAGLMLGYYFVGHTYTSNDPYANQPGDPGYNSYNASYNGGLGLSLFVGARYYLSDKVGIWAELGYGYSNLAIGVNFKL